MKIFYGWWVLLGLFLIYTANNGILIHTLPLFYPELMSEFGWNEDQVTRPAAQFFIVGAFMTPLVAILFDRYSTRLIMLFGAALVTAGFLVYANIASLPQLTMVYLVFALGLAACGLVPNMLILSRWFRRYRGIAVGILLMGSSLGGALFPLLVKETLTDGGWRESVIVVAMIGAAMMLAGIVFWARNYPADKGLLPDGDAGAAALSKPAPPGGRAGGRAGPTLRAALKTRVFYLLAVATGALWFCIVGILNHQPIYLRQDVGVSVEHFPLILSLFFWSAIAGKLLFGYLSDKFNRILIMLLSVLNLLLGLLILRLAELENTGMLYAYAIILGAGFSGAFAMIQVVIAEFFAGDSFGKILGIYTMIDSIAGGIGIRYLGASRVARDSYLPAFDSLIALCLAVSLMLLYLLRLHKHHRRQLARQAA